MQFGRGELDCIVLIFLPELSCSSLISSSRLKASLLALAGKFDIMILPAIAPPHSYLVISEELTETANISQQNCSVDETESEDNAGKLMKQVTTPQRACITAFSSGTGLAGIIGFAYNALFSDLLGWGLSATVWSAMGFSLAYSVIYRKGLHGMDDSAQRLAQPEAGPSRVLESPLFVDEFGINETSLTRRRHCYDSEDSGSALEMANAESMHPITMQQLRTDSSVASFTAFERFKLVLSFWRYTIPLFTVYAAEYMMQAGVWSAIGFPVTSATARAQFYHYSNWTVSGYYPTPQQVIFLLLQFCAIISRFFTPTVSSGRVHIAVVGKRVDRLDSDSLVNANPPSCQSLFLLVRLTTSLLVQLRAHAAMLLCWFARR